MRIVLFAITGFLLSCQQTNSSLTTLVKAHFEAANRHDVAALRLSYDDSVKGESPNWGKIVTGPDSIAHQYERMFVSTPDLKYELKSIALGPNHATAEYILSGTLTNLEKEVPEFMRGKAYSFPVCTIFEFKDEKIIREGSYFDQVAFLRQVGYFEQGTK